MPPAEPPAPPPSREPSASAGHTASAPPPVVEVVPLGIKIAYGLPGMAGAAMAIPIAIHLTIFYSDAILVPLGLIALVKAIARAFDALTDPLMGWLSDRTHSRWGRRRPWMALGAPLAAVAFIAMFTPPPGLSPMTAAGWFALTYTGYYLFHTVYQIPHYGLGPEITQDYRQRASLYGWSEGFSVVGTLIAAVAPWAIGRVVGGERETFTVFSLIFGGLLTLFYWNLVARVRERPDYVNRPPNPLVPGVRRVMRNHAFRLLLVIYLIGAVTGAIPGLMMPYFTKYVIVPDDPDLWLAVFLATYFGSAFACMPLWVFAVKRFGKKPVWIFSFVSVILGLFALFALVGQGDVLPMALILAWTGSTFSARLLLAPAMQADVIDYDELRTGKRREAQYGGLWSIMTKFTVIPSMSIPLAVMASVGYVPNVPQSEAVQLTIRVIFAIAPAVTSLIALALAIFYPIDEAVHARILEAIARHRRGEDAVDPITGESLAPPSADPVDEQTGWFLDHFSTRELRRIAAGGSAVLGTLLAVGGSLLLLALALGSTWTTIDDVETEPGPRAVFMILVAGVALTGFCYHVIRLRAAARLRAHPLAEEKVRRHLESRERLEAGAARAERAALESAAGG